jgi:DHA2 family multidrug resistance protein
MMPIVGMLTSKVDVRKLLALGFFVAGMTLVWLGSLNLNAGYWDIFWPQLLQGTGMALTFVPLTTATMQAIPQQRMGKRHQPLQSDAEHRRQRRHRGDRNNADAPAPGRWHGARREPFAYDVQTQTLLAQIKAGFMARGADAVTATERAYAALHGMLLQQASMVSFVWLFRLLGGIFLMLLPLILIMRRPKGRVAAPAH